MEIKDRIKELRQVNELTQTQLANKLNSISVTKNDPIIYSQTVSYWENGRDPSVNALIKMSKNFNVSVDYLLGLDEKKNIIEKWYDEGLEKLSIDNIKQYLTDYDEEITKTVFDMFNSFIYVFFNLDDVEEREHKMFNYSDLVSMYYFYRVIGLVNALIDDSNKYHNETNKKKADQILAAMLNHRTTIDFLVNGVIEDFTSGISKTQIIEYLGDETHYRKSIFENLDK